MRSPVSCLGVLVLMPNPLSEVRSDATAFNFDLNAAEQRPELCAQIVQTIADWARLDAVVGTVFSRLMGAESEKGAAIYGALISVNSQDAALDALAQMMLNQDGLDIFLAIKSISKSPRDQRNQMAHGIWGYCDELPDAILLLPPKAMTKFVERVDDYYDFVREGGKPVRGPEPDLSQIFVYRAADFKFVRKQIADATNSWHLFRIMALASWSLPEGLTSAEARRRLLAIPEIRAKVDKARLNRQEPPLPPDEPPPAAAAQSA